MKKVFKREEGETSPVKMDAKFTPSSLNIENRTVDSVFTTERKVLRTPWFDEPYNEILSVDLAHIRTERVEKGIPVLDGHDWSGSVVAQLGRADNLRVEDGKLVCTMRFSKKESAEIVFQDIQDGIVDKTSIGYRVYKYEDITEDDDKIRTLKAIDWEPFEISCVPVPADIDAQIRSGLNKPEIINNNEGDNSMGKQKRSEEETEEKKLATAKAKEAKAEDEDEVEEKAEGDESEEEGAATEEVSEEESEEEEGESRSVRIIGMVSRAGLDIKFAQRMITEKKSEADVSDLIIEQLKRNQGAPVKNHVEVSEDNKVKRMEGMTEAILHRAGSKSVKGKEVSEAARSYRNMSLMQMAREMTGLNFEHSNSDVLRRAFHTTSDFPKILMDATNKTLQAEYAELPQTFEPFVSRGSLSDFKMKNTVRSGDFPALKLLKEHGDMKAGTMGEEAEAYKLDSYGTKIKISRQTIINDDLDAFALIPGKAARSARILEGDLVYKLITSNPAMADGSTLFHAANHGNVVAAGTLDAKMDEAFQKMMLQVSINKQVLNLTPSFLVVPVALKAAAERFISNNFVASKVADVNIYGGKLTVIADARIDAASGGNKWYLIADKSQVASIELGTLDGAGPQTNVEDVFAEGMIFSVLHDVGAGIVDHRGMLLVGAV